MKGLVVIHTEIGYLDVSDMGKTSANRFEIVFNSIAEEMKTYLARGDLVYLLGCESNSSDSPLIFPKIRELTGHDNLVYVSGNMCAEPQFLLTKEQMLLDGVSQASLCGVSRDCCVQDMYMCLIGKANLTEAYKNGYKKLRWPDEKFKGIFTYNLDTLIEERLT
ncbi:hypothetical protein EXS72_00810 [Candidatus Pacearchaeota archaeon]|nr:hypothetical protein [Candidatus Pacearchaeota archaeon]